MLGSDAIVIATILFLLLSAVVLIFMVYIMRKQVLEYEEHSSLLEERSRLLEERGRLLEELARLGVQQVRREKRRSLEAEILYNGNAYAINTDCYKIGSDSLCNLIIPDISVSNLHCEIVYYDNTFMLSDLFAENGTYVNGKRVTRVIELHDGDEIRMGYAVMTFKHRNEQTADDGETENPSQQAD